MQGLSERGFAAICGVRQQSVHRAKRRGLLDLCRDGSIDRDGERSARWRDSHVTAAVAPPIDTAAANLVSRSGALFERLYDLELLRANSIDRAELRETLLGEGVAWALAMTELPHQLGHLLAPILRLPAEPITAAIAAAMAAYLARRPEVDEEIDAALSKAASRWAAFPPRHQHDPPPVPLFVAPVSLADALERSSRIRAELAELRVAVRSGTALAKGAVALVVDGLRLAWIQGATEEFPVTLMPTLFSRLGMTVSSELSWACDLMIGDYIAGRLTPIWPGRLRTAPLQFRQQAVDVLLAHQTGIAMPVEPLAGKGGIPAGQREAHAAAVTAWRERVMAITRATPPRSADGNGERSIV